MKHLDRSDIMAIGALLVSLLALGVSVFEARILKEQQEIMFSQQKASVWPYLLTDIQVELSDAFSITYSVANKGIGPTKISEAQLFLNGEEQPDYVSLFRALRMLFPDTANLTLSLGALEGEVLSADEQRDVIVIRSSRFDGDLELMERLELDYQICYCSIYDDCWTVTGGANPAPGCTLK